jgi:hypothetical protein
MKTKGCITFSSCDCTIIRGMEPILITSSDIRIIVDPFLFVSGSPRHRFSVWSFTYMEFDMTKNIILFYVTMLHFFTVQTNLTWDGRAYLLVFLKKQIFLYKLRG